ncbi:MAG: glycoside hydrolase TIM-barrel-like domain-containing protein [Alphaproteobacteria bacterium]|nr:glycoside hydrolase TIM-barrel-like domain-containing protein [Alphaproteobacteria bacterium]
MASIILSSVGTAVGAATGLPFGGQLAGILGAGIGNRISGTSKHHFEGARLETLAVQTSTYGRTIPMVFGSVRIAGNVIWSQPMKEIASTTTTRTGGKGGAASRKTSNSSTTFSYSVTLAIAMCEGEVTRVNRVWADSQLLDLSQGTYRIYKGSETQLPDPLIESAQGVGATPAYRGLAYIVIEDFPLGNFGNRIPNFTFEVTRRAPQQDVAAAPVESLVKSIMLLPGSGEFVYDTQVEYKVNGSSSAAGGILQSGHQVPLNLHTAEGKANVLVALDQLQETFPNLEWVGVVANWFGTSTDIASCEIWPCVEYQANGQTTPDDWQVAGFTRGTARLIGNDGGKSRYGGTPDDGSLLRLLAELRARGLKIFFYPQLLMDVAGKPWRGFLSGDSAQVANFFTKPRGYHAYITHYANLVAGKVDAFAIGTEMRDLTKITSSAGVFPAVSQLVTLAATVKTILGSAVQVTYAADWSEYHHTDGGWYHLDPLWASPHIDVVGIDAYFPLTDAVQTGYDIAALRAGWRTGEGYDFYYTDAARTTKASLDAPYAWKNIDWWWNNPHVNPDGAPTAWVPQSKPVWFTEYGFASVDGTSNEPNVFIDNSASASAFPRFSRGRVDFMAQRVAIAATEAEWAGSSMVPRRFLWTWDARPYPHWPDLTGVWADGGNWVTGHWVQGKLGASHVAAAVEQIATRAGLTHAQIDTSHLQMQLDGFVISDRVTARAALQQLMQAYFFTIKESANALVAILRDATVDAEISASDCIEQKAGDQLVPYVLTRQEDLVLPQRQEVHFLNRLQQYETHVEAAQRSTQDATDTLSLKLSLVLSGTHARAIAETTLADRWAERSRVELQLPIAYAALEPGDVIQLTDGPLQHRIRIHQVQIGRPGMVKISGAMDAAQAWDGYIAPTVGSNGALVLPNPKTRLEVLDMPALPGDATDALRLRFAVTGIADGWKGATLVRVMPSGDDEILLTIDQPATIGAALDALPVGASQQFDEVHSVDVALLSNATLVNASELSVLGGANVALLGDELIQFRNATPLAAGIYRLSGLLRGRLGTEAEMATHAAGERFVLLDEAVVPLTIPLSNQGQQWTVRAVTFGDALSNGTAYDFSIRGESLKPLSPVLPLAVRDTASGDIRLSWVRRTRMDGGLRDYVDVPLAEQSELYAVQVMLGDAVVRSWQAGATSLVYTAAQQMADFATVPTSLSLRITQLSGWVGPGKPLVATLPVQ